jgi:hypothetical protein
MLYVRTKSQIEAEFAALSSAADKAGLALACAFSTYDEFLSDMYRQRSTKIEHLKAHKRRSFGAHLASLCLLSFVFLML